MISILNAIIYGIVQGITEFLPISSNAHLRLTQLLIDPTIENAKFTAFTAVIQLGTTLAVLIYFRKELGAAINGWLQSLSGKNKHSVDAKTGWAVFYGTLPILLLGLLLKHKIEHTWRGLYFIGASFIVMGILMAVAEKVGSRKRQEKDVTVTDGVVVGLWQCLALIPGMSRSGSTITGGLFAGFDRVAAARFSFLLGVPSITAAGLKELYDARHDIVGGDLMSATIVATIVSFFVGYAAIAFLMNFLQKKGIGPFVIYRIVLGLIVIGLVASGKVEQNAGEEETSKKPVAMIVR